jgi:hypothetical protein
MLPGGKMSHDANVPGHGNSAATWVTVMVIIAAFSIGAFFFFSQGTL